MRHVSMCCPTSQSFPRMLKSYTVHMWSTGCQHSGEKMQRSSGTCFKISLATEVVSWRCAVSNHASSARLMHLILSSNAHNLVSSVNTVSRLAALGLSWVFHGSFIDSSYCNCHLVLMVMLLLLRQLCLGLQARALAGDGQCPHPLQLSDIQCWPAAVCWSAPG